MIEQPVLPPRTERDLLALYRAGRLVAADGSPLHLRPCPTCRNMTVGETCPQTLPCDICHAGPGQPCRRPSGHEYVNGGFHRARQDAAALIDAERQEAADPTVPAPWPTGRLPL